MPVCRPAWEASQATLTFGVGGEAVVFTGPPLLQDVVRLWPVGKGRGPGVPCPYGGR
jgi:hypothetical protein